MIVPLDDVWITADFRATQLTRIKPGQSVAIRVDTLGRDYRGRVDSVPGRDPLFSLFPPKNAARNNIKVVQQPAVRIRIDNDQDSEHLLWPGMPVKATVKVH